MTVPPSPSEEDHRRVSRERATLPTHSLLATACRSTRGRSGETPESRWPAAVLVCAPRETAVALLTIAFGALKLVAAVDPLQTFITTPAAGRFGCEADIHTGLLHVGADRKRDGAELLWNTPVEPLR